MLSAEPAFSSVDAFRDVGAAVKARAGSTLIRERILYLSGPVQDATDSDNSRLRNDYGIKTLVDYGWGRRVRTFPDDFKDKKTAYDEWKMIQFGIVKVMGIQFCWTSLRPRPYVEALRKRLPLWQKAKTVGYAISDQTENIQELYREAIIRRGMLNDTFDRLEHAKSEIRELFNRVLSNLSSYPILLSGSPVLNEAGLITMLLLCLLDVPPELIDEDLLYPQEGLEERKEETSLAELRAEARENRGSWARAVKDHLDSKYGGVVAYFASTGVTVASMDAIKDIFLPHAEGKKLVKE